MAAGAAGCVRPTGRTGLSTTQVLFPPARSNQHGPCTERERNEALAGGIALRPELAVADAAHDRAAFGLLGRDADGPLRVAVADQLGTVERLAATLAAGLAVALVLVAGVGVGLPAGQAEAAEGVQVQRDRRVQVGDGVGVAVAGLVGELDVGEAVDGVGLGVGRPFQSELASQIEVAAVVVLALAAGVLDPADMG